MISADPGARIAVELEHARGHHARWLLVGGVIGVLCVLKLGTLGKGVGVVVLLLAAYAGYKLLMTYLNPPGTIVVDGGHVRLPRGLCRGPGDELERAKVSNAYFLRRSVPWTRAAPVLVIETGSRSYVYPRDWFSSEADQRRILEALAPS